MAIKFTIRESKWHGCRYSVADPYFDSWDIVERTDTWAAIDSWCREMFGDIGDVWSTGAARWYINGGKYYFRRPADLTAFMLKWAK